MDGHQKRRKTIENRIVQAAMELFMQHGFKRVSIENVAGKAAVSKVTLYKYYGNKQTLIRECILLSFRSKADEVKARLESMGGLQDKLEFLMEAKTELIRSFSGEMMQELAMFDPEFIAELMAIRRDAIMGLTVPILKEARAMGNVASEIADESFVVFFDLVGTGMLSSPYYKEYAGRNSNAFDEIQRIALSCLGLAD